MSDSKLTILLIDDDDTQRTIYRKVFTTDRFEVIGEAENGQVGVQLFEQLEPQITICDIHMPVMDGIMALKKMMAIRPQACIIMLTVVNHPEVWQECIRVGARYFLQKDISYSKMQNIVMESWQEQQRMLDD